MKQTKKNTSKVKRLSIYESMRQDQIKLIKRDNKYYLALEKNSKETAIFFSSDSYIPYEFYNSLLFRSNRGYDDSVLGKILYHEESIRPTPVETCYPFLEFLKIHKYRLDENFNFFNDYDLEKAIDAINQYINDGNKLDGIMNLKSISMPNPSNTYHRRGLLEIDFKKPKEEILAFVTKVKDEYDNNNNLLLSLDEFLGIFPIKETINCSLKDCEFYKHPTTKNLAYKLTDALFIFDCNRYGLSKAYTLREINRYWNDVKKLHNDAMDIKTLNVYLKFMQDLIENEKFEEFFTGIKN
jgi:hypothetical protein